MKSDYHERRERRIDTYQSLAAKNDEISTNSYNHAKDLGSVIPMGQPILVGHHSEKSHRNHLKKIDNAMRKSCEADDKAKYYRDRAESLLNSTAISSDNPDALELLREKLERLTATQELYKAINKICRKKIGEAEKVTQLVGLGLTESTAINLLIPDRLHGIGIPHYRMTNNNGVIKNTRDRIAHLEKIAQMQTTEEEINGATLKVSIEDNRIQIFFPGKPVEEVRTMLKRNGFRWAPSVGAWMRQISNWALREAREILNSETYIKSIKPNQ